MARPKLIRLILIGLVLPLTLVGISSVTRAAWGAGHAARPAGSDLAALPHLLPPGGLAIAGPKAGSVDVTYTFTATLGSGDTPLNYTWEATDYGPLVHTGGLSDTASFTWRTAGLKTINVTAANGEGQTTATYQVAIAHLPLDIAVVFDVSGSMDYETTCFDCWEPYPDTHPNYDVIANPWPTNGTFNPMPDVTTNPVCSQPPTASTVNIGGTDYMYLVHEAELYSRDVPLHGWKFDQRAPGYGFWVLQRAERGADEVGADARGAYLRTHPYPVYSQSSITDPTTGQDNYPQLQGAAYDEECFSGPDLSGACWQTEANNLNPPENTPPSDVPWVEYDFTPQWSGTTHIWMRAQGGYDVYSVAWTGQSATAMNEYNRAIFWQVLETDQGGEVLISLVNTNGNHIDGGIYTSLNESDDPRRPKSDRWRWVKLGSVATTQSVMHTLRLYQGSAGFNLDKLIFTSYGGGSPNTNATSLNNAFETLLDQNGGRGPEATPGSATREACNICNPVFGQEVQPSQCSCMMGPGDTVVSNPLSYPAGGSGFGCTAVVTTTDHLIESDLFHDIDPLRSAKEALKKFAIQLEPGFDQVGFVPFSTSVYNTVSDAEGTSDNTVIRSELQCLRWAEQNAVEGVDKCFKPATNPISYTNIIRVVERVENWSATNIGQGMREGLEELGIETINNTAINSGCEANINDKEVCDRGGAAHRVLILMSDGSPNRSSGCPSSAQYGGFRWEGVFGQGNAAYDCAIFYAREAANNNVSVFTIGLGPGVNSDLMAAMATGSDPTTGQFYFEPVCGRFFAASGPADLDAAFAEIAALARSCPPNLTIAKSGPATAIANQPLTYTLTITNLGPAPATNVTITDTIPAGATYLGSGMQMGGVVSWTLPSLVAGSVTQTTFVVSASEPITNSEYGVRAAGGYEALGAGAVVTWIEPGLGGSGVYFLPLIVKE
jgi:uncharacterized repeat protein (TIGR01451 family)